MEEILFCRLCAHKKDSFVGIYDEEGHKLNIENKINKCLHIEIYETDSLPKCVCLDCCYKLDQFSIFMDSSASAQATLHRLFQDDSNMKPNIVNHSQTQLELTSLDCNSAYQVMKDFDTGEQISVQHLSHGESLNEGSNEVNDCSRTDNGVYSTEDVVNEDFIDDDEDVDEDDNVEDIDEKFNDVNNDGRNVIDDSSQHRIIRCFSGYVECLLPDKEMEDNLGSRRKRSTPVKCFSDTNINSVKVKQKSKTKRKLQEEQHQGDEDNNQQLVQRQDILSHNENHNNKLVNGSTNIVISTHEQHLQAQSDQRHNGVIEFNECKDMINENGTGDFSEFSSNCKDDEEFRNENNEPDLINENNEPDLIADGKNNSNNKNEWDMLTWICSDCNKELPDVQALREHHNIVHKQSPKYMCNQCSKVYTQYHCFFSHVKRHRNLVKYSCDECGKCFSNRKVLDMHLSTHSDTRPYLCTVCGKGFRQQSALYIHGRCHLPEEMKNRFACDECDKRFSTKPNLVTHKRIHTGVRNFTCDQCGKSFIQKGNLDAHLLTHSQDKPFNCDLCNKGFKTSMQLRKHHTVHTGAKPHQCDVCGRTFRERGTLREHHRIHTGAMPFTCEFCGKAFRFKGILTTHRRQHTGERPYSCLECQHHFTNWPNYNKHMKRRHGINTSRTTRTKTTSDALPSQDQPQTQQQQDQAAEHVVQHIVPDTPPLYEDSISATPPEDLSNSGQTSAHFYQPAINVTMSAPMTATYHVAPHPNMLSFYNLTQLQMDPSSLNSVNLNTPVDVIHSVSSVQQQLIHHR